MNAGADAEKINGSCPGKCSFQYIGLIRAPYERGRKYLWGLEPASPEKLRMSYPSDAIQSILKRFDLHLTCLIFIFL